VKRVIAVTLTGDPAAELRDVLLPRRREPSADGFTTVR
jgi:hypothetical protein